MATRHSGFARQPNERYCSPPWLIEPLFAFVDFDGMIWECAAGEGDLLRAMKERGAKVVGSDIQPHPGCAEHNFLSGRPPLIFKNIVTNPPYGFQNRTAVEFARIGLRYIRATGGKMALFLTYGFDAAPGRKDVIDAPEFAGRINVRDRVVWFDRPGASDPSSNHAWYIWDAQQLGAPRLYYWPK
jgi:hypothetical protein